MVIIGVHLVQGGRLRVVIPRHPRQTSTGHVHGRAPLRQGPRDGPRATWAEGNHRNGLRIDFCANMSRAMMAVYRNQLGLVRKDQVSGL
jgi:hypothetical protein